MRLQSFLHERPVAAGVMTLLQAQAQACEHLVQAFEPFGGVMSGEDLVRRLTTDVEQPISRVAHWIVDDHMLHFAARGVTCIPCFQFDGPMLRPLLRRAIVELRGIYDAFELAEWFVTPNAWLDDRMPAALVLAGDIDLLDAARADRYLVAGN